ncbi:Bug family tripartite tricarboxylate transporter substrate binding protein [Bordetella sp. 15P40C-2]|uniref:Bug family tripartite tricarboxylate transporter substrate binding protein n=1 Tax=Bordetella sp. 15P40C-2 TaxID=2572246 RepID=UPI00351B6317
MLNKNSLLHVKRMLGAMVGVAAAWAPVSASQAAYPDKPITVVVPFAPGGSTDQIGRIVAEHLQKRFKTPVVVENKPGANGTVGNAYVARTKADGYTLLIGGTDIAASPYLYKNLPFDPKDFIPIGLVAEFPFVMLTNKSKGFTTVQQFVDYAKKNPDKVSFSSAGLGNSTHLAGETFKKAAGLDGMVHAPYNGSAPALAAVLGNQVDTVFDTAITAVPLATGGQATALAVIAQQRLAQLPDVPTMTELNYNEYSKLVPWSWKGVFAPAGTPPEVVATLRSSLADLASDPAFKQRIENAASLPVPPKTPEQLEQFLADQRAGWKRVIEEAQVQPQ